MCLGGDGGVGNMDLKLCHGSFQQDVIIRIFSIYHIESAVIEEGICHLVLVEFHFLRGADRTVAASVMTDGNHSVFSSLQIDSYILVAILFCGKIQGLHLFFSIKNGDGEPGTVIFQRLSLYFLIFFSASCSRRIVFCHGRMDDYIGVCVM